MKVEKIRLLAEDFGLDSDIDDLIEMRRYECGDYAWFESTRKEHAEKYGPMQEKLKKRIMKRIGHLTEGMFADWSFSYGRLSDGTTFFTLWNPDWRS